MLPVIISGLLYYLLNPIVDFLERKGLKRIYAISFVFFLIAVLLIWGLAVVIPAGFALAQGAITYGMELMQALFSIVQGIVTTVMSGSGMAGSVTELPTEIIDKIESVGMLESIPLWIVTLLGSLLITVLSFVMILTVYGRMFKIYMYTAIAPIPISSFAGEPTQSIGKNFLRSYVGVCLEGAIIALACIIYSAYAASPPAVGDTGLSAVTIVWNYVGELVFNLLVLVGAIKASDRIVREMMGLGG